MLGCVSTVHQQVLSAVGNVTPRTEVCLGLCATKGFCWHGCNTLHLLGMPLCCFYAVCCATLRVRSLHKHAQPQ